MKNRALTVVFPTGGLSRRYAYQTQPPYTTPNAVNVWPIGPVNRRQRGGRRAGLKKFCTGTAGGVPRMLATLPKAAGTAGTSASTTIFRVAIATRESNFTAAQLTFARAIEGVYTYAGTYNGYAYQLHEGGTYVRWQSDANTWVISAALGTTGTDYYQSTFGFWFSYQNASALWLMCTGVAESSASDYGYGFMTAVGNALYLGNQAAGALASWPTGTLSSTSGRIPWTTKNGVLYILDGGTLKTIEPWTPAIANVTATAGSIPTGCDLLRRYRGRFVMAGHRDVAWYMSRVDDPTDWDYTVDWEDPARAVASTVAEAGELGGPINAIIPFRDDHCVFGCDNSLWVLRGDPGDGGRIDALSRQIGVICDDAWCYTPEGILLFMDFSGLYALAPGAGSWPEPISRDKLPADLRNLNPYTSDVVMEFDPQHDGVLIQVAPRDDWTSTSSQDDPVYWWYDLPTQSFWEWTFPTASAPRWMAPFAWSAGYDQVLLLACDDGYMRNLDDITTTDDGTTVTGYCDVGPIRLGGDDYRDGQLQELIGTIGASSASITWKLYTANSCEACAQATTPIATGTWAAGRGNSEHPRRRAGAAMLRLHGTGLWEFETAHMRVATVGKQRN